MNKLEREIREQIINSGPISITDYMMACLTHPVHGYYTTHTPIGGGATSTTQGDFITAPEVSQMFGELIGVWCMQMWQQLGAPDRFNLVEIGPGRGTLMTDLLRAAKALPEFLAGAEVHLVEVSETLKQQQHDALEASGLEISWVQDVAKIPEQPTLIIANELLDALPFRQWVKVGDKWYERGVGLDGDKLTFALRPNLIDVSELPVGYEAEPEGMIFESAPAREGYMARIADFIRKQTGACMFIDYGPIEPGFGDTFQAIHGHAFADVLAGPGENDLTNHVCFAPLLDVIRANGCTAPNAIDQGTFLLNMGLLERAGQLGAGGDKALQNKLQSAVERLVAPDQMGELFKVMAFGKIDQSEFVLPGFEKP